MKTKSFGFTLAEVLITLGVIGVVAAITMPTLIQNHRKHEVETKLKKVYSMVNQAIKLSEVEYGDISGWNDYSDSMVTIEERVEMFNKYIGKNMQILKTEKAEDNAYIYLSDGSILNLRHGTTIYYLINKKAKNKPVPGANQFMFRFTVNEHTNNGVRGFEPYMFNWLGTKDDLYHASDGVYGCADSSGNFCTKLIQYNGWKIPKDYPVKF